MSRKLNKYMKKCDIKSSINETVVHRKNSFDRFGDDLSELLLSYLSFEDKFRFECLSKRFQRLIFNKETEIDVSVCGLNKTKKIKYLRSVLKKCPKVKTFYFDIKVINKQTLKLMTNHLKQMNGFKICLNPNTFIAFKEVLQYMAPKLEDVCCHSNIGRPFNGSSLFQTKPFERLESISVVIKDLNNDLKILRIILENKKSLRALFLDVFKILTTTQLKTLFNNLLIAKKLITLRINCFICDQLFITYLRQYSKNCPTLKNIILRVKISDPYIYEDIYGLSQLKSLTINNMSSKKMTILEEPNECPNILELYIKGFVVSDKLFSSLSKGLPRLRIIECENVNITEKSFKALTKLKDLRRIDLKAKTSITLDNKLKEFWSSFISESVFFDLLFKCQKLNYFRFEFRDNKFILTNNHLTDLRDGKIPVIKYWFPLI